MTAPCETASLILLPFGLVCGSSSAEGVLPGAGQTFTPGRPCLYYGGRGQSDFTIARSARRRASMDAVVSPKLHR
jgi:hypothetical protein